MELYRAIIHYMDKIISDLSTDLFWDVEKGQVDPETHAKWLLERVLQRGRWEDWKLVRDYYGKERLRAILPSLKMDKKSENFLNLYCTR